MTRALPVARPPRYAVPLVACDEAVAVVDGDALLVTGVTRIHGQGPYLAGHFAEITIFPGVFILEAVLQAVVQALGERDGLLPQLHKVRSLRFLAPLHPGDQMSFEARVSDPAAPDRIAVSATCRRSDGIRAATMVVECRWSR